MIKIYKVNTFEKFEYLLKTLHERGAKWMNEDALDNEVLAKLLWEFASCNGLYVYRYGNKVTISDVEDIDEALDFYGYKGEECTIIEDVKLPKPIGKLSEKPKVTEIHFHDTTGGKLGGDRIFRVTEEIQVNLCKSDTVEQPSHYIGEHGLEVREIEENFLVRYQDGHLAHLAGALLEYLLRAPSKGKLAEDIKKVQYLANEMAEYVDKTTQK